MAPFLTTIEKIEYTSSNPNSRGIAFVAHTEPSLINRLGTVFGIVELVALSDTFSDKLLDIIRDLETEYYLPPFNIEESAESRFEQCLQRANRRLHKALQESPQRINIENIGSVLGLIYQDKIHLSYTGGVSAFLFHRRKRYDHAIIDILSQATDKKQVVTPEKLFSNIISGVISEKDDVFICNDAILEYIAQSELATTITDKAPLVAAQNLETQLTETAGDANNFFALIISPRRAQVSMEETEPLPQALHPQSSINRLMTTQAKTEQYLTPSMMPSWKKVLVIVLAAITKATSWTWAHTKIASAWTIREGRRFTKRIVHRLQTKNEMRRAQKSAAMPAPKDPVIKATPQLTVVEEDIIIDSIDQDTTITDTITEIMPAIADIEIEEITDEAPLSAQVIDKAEEETMSATSLPTPHITYSIQKGALPYISDKLNQIITAFMALTRQQKILLVAGFVFFFIFSQSIVWKGQQSSVKNSSGLEQTMKQIEDHLNTAEAQNIFNDEVGARASLAQAEELLKNVPDRRAIHNDRETLLKKIAQLKQSLEKVTFIENPQVLADLGKINSNIQIHGFAVSGNTLWTIDNNAHALYVAKRDSGESTRYDLGNSTTFIDIAAINDTHALVLSDQKELFTYDINSKTLTSIIKDQPISALGIYGDRLYTLQRDRNQIYRHQAVNGLYNSGTAWLKEPADLKDAQALAIDGSLYVTAESGAITTYTSGRRQAIDFAKLDTPLKPTTIATTPESNYIYVLDPTNKRVVVYDKKGALKTQISSKSWNTLQGLAYVNQDKKLYLLADNRILVIDISL